MTLPEAMDAWCSKLIHFAQAGLWFSAAKGSGETIWLPAVVGVK